MAFTYVKSGQVVTGAEVTSNDFVTVQAGGSIVSTSVDGGFLFINAGGSANGTVVTSGSEQVSGVESGSIVSGGGLDVMSGGVATGDTILNNGLMIQSGGRAVNTTVGSKGLVGVYAGGTLTGEHLLPGANVDFAGIAYVPGATATLDAATDILTISAGANVTQLQLTGDYTNDGFVLGSDNAILNFGRGAPGTTLSVTAGPVQTPPVVSTSSSTGVGAYSIIDARTPFVAGTAPAGATVSVYGNGTVQSETVAANAAGGFAVSLAGPLGLGKQVVDFTTLVTGAAGTQVAEVSVPLFVLPTPMDGTTSPSLTSLDLDRLLGQGYDFQFTDGTSAVQLTNGTVAFGAATPDAFVQRLYVALLGRPGDAAGLGTLTTELANGSAPAVVAAQILDSTEYATLHGGGQSDQQFATGLYSGFYQRTPDDAGLATILRQLSGGMSRAAIAVEFAQSDEAKAVLAGNTAQVWALDAPGALVSQMYEIAYGRAPDPGGLATLKQQLASGLPGTTLAQEIVATPEFQALHGQQDLTGLVDQLYASATGQASGHADASLVDATRQSGVANTLYALAASNEAARYLSPDIHPVLPVTG